MGSTARETQILDLIDTGLPQLEVASRLGLSRSTVRSVVERYGNGTDNFAKDTRRATAALLEAIRRHHPERVQETVNG